MPVKACKEDGKPGWKWGDAGKCYTYPEGDEKASGQAKQKAYIQGVAATGGKGEEAQFEPPDAGDAPKAVKDILTKAYTSCRSAWVSKNPGDKENAGNKTSCAKQAWGAVQNAGWAKDKDGKWAKEEKQEIQHIAMKSKKAKIVKHC